MSRLKNSPTPTASSAKRPAEALKKLLGLLTQHKFIVALTFLLAIAGVVLSILGPKILGNAVNIVSEDFIIAQSTPDYDFRFGEISQIAITLTVFYLLAFAFRYLSVWIINEITSKVIKDLRSRISQKINRLPISYFDRHPFGDTLSRITNDVDMILQTLQQSLVTLVSVIVMLIGIVVIMLTINWQLTLIAIASIALSMFAAGFISKRSQRFFKQQQNSLGKLTGHIEESYSGQNIIRNFNYETSSTTKFDEVNKKLYASGWKSQFFSGLAHPVMHFISNLSYVTSAIIGAYLVISGHIGIGDLSAFIQYVNQIGQPIGEFAQIIASFQSAIAASERVFEFLEEPEQTLDDAKTKLTKVTGDIVFDKVRFSYDGDQEVIKGFSAKIKAGSQVAIVGPTGAGKTTMVNLLMRFYDPSSGSITIDGIKTTDLSRQNVRELFGMVLQDTWLTTGTIRDNLRYGKLKASDTEIKSAAKTAHVDHMIEALPNSYRTEISEEAELISVGEKQLLTIARAMIAEPQMVILDEATSNVDTRTETLIQAAMDKLVHGKTSFIIAHRLSTIKNADLILVMENGNIVEQGNHQQLLKQNGAYAKLYDSQFSEE